MTVRWHTGGASDRSTFDTLGGAGELGLRPVLSTHSLPKPSPRVLLRAPPQDSAALDGFAARHYQQQVVILVDDMPLAALTLHPTAFGGSGQILGDFTQARAKALAVSLQHRLPTSLALQAPA